MDSPPSPCPPTTVRRNPPRRAKQTLPAAPHPQETVAFEKLKVFLRIRPLEVAPPRPVRKPPKADARAPGKVAPEKVERRKNGTCLAVNGPSSVTLSAPPSLLDQKRAKNEVYDGFSFVFPPDSTQEEIYDKVVNPILMDFMGGKSTLLVALGPTGSGKTYTMFGCARNLGIVPLTLKQLFNGPSQGDVHAMRSYYLSMFEIHSERGKGERILDLSPDGVELSFQQSTIVGLKEVIVSNIAEADKVVALGMLKRSTAATSANEQSSRSQCIINIRRTEKSLNEHNSSSHSAVLTIADLAGAERERKTGNQGARLLESNFINNTSMVFGLCLRSLLEHQRNPRKPLEKHFKNSLLTRYLREYMEGKKRMTLILTVKPGEEDYADTSFLLRQASPYMKIKFTNLEEILSLPNQKRSNPSLVRVYHHKRRKINVSETSLDDERIHVSDGNNGFKPSEQDADSKKLREIGIPQSSFISSKILEPVMIDTPMNDILHIELQRMTRREEIMRNFSKALWTVLKQYKQKVIESENKVQNLSEALRKDEIQIMELRKELEELKSHCSCHKLPSVGETSCAVVALLHCCGTGLGTPSHQVNSSNINSAFQDRGIPASPISYQATEVNPGLDVCGVAEDQLDRDPIGLSKNELPSVQETQLGEEKKISGSQGAQSISYDQNFDGQNHQLIDQMPDNSPEMTLIHDDLKGHADFGPTGTSTYLNKSDIDNGSSSSLSSFCIVDDIIVSSSSDEKITHLKEEERLIDHMPENAPGMPLIHEDFKGLADFGTKGTSINLNKSDISNGSSSSVNSLCMVDDMNVSSSSIEKITHLKECKRSPELDLSHVQHVKSSEKHHVRKVLKERNDLVSKCSNAVKPKRKLLPASAMLLKELHGLDTEAANRDDRGKITAGERRISQTSVSLLNLLRKES